MFVRIAPDLEVMQCTAGNVLLMLRAVDPTPAHNTMPIVSTAHFELDDDQDAAYRDEPGLAR